MHTFQRDTELAASPEEIFSFHENPHNIRKISPFFLKVIQVQANTTANQDDTFTLHLSILGIPLSWTGKWQTVNNPSLLVDTASLFPFKTWCHEHRFERVPGGTRMTDCVVYSMPFGWLGKLFGATVFRLQLIFMFAGRHAATRRYFSDRRS